MERMDSPTTLEAFRARLDGIDAQLLKLLAERRRLVGEVFEWKDAHGLPRIDPTRESALRQARVRDGQSLGLPDALTEAVFDAILADARTRT